MALADTRTRDDSAALDMRQRRVPADPTPCAPPCHCATALGALDRALGAIAQDDIQARCAAVAVATEAVTCLFLERDAIGQEIPAQDLGRLFESILGRLLRINLTNDAGRVREAATMIERLRGACRGADGAVAFPMKT